MRMGTQQQYNNQDRHVNESAPTRNMDSSVFSLVYYLKNLDTNYSFNYLFSLIMCERVEKMLGRSALCIRVFSDPFTFLIIMLIFYIFAHKLPLDLF